MMSAWVSGFRIAAIVLGLSLGGWQAATAADNHSMAAPGDAPGAAAGAIKADPNHFVLTLVKKDKSHPYFGIGDSWGFAIDGVQGAELILKRGETYTFEVRSSTQHDVYVTADEMGWGAAMVTDGVTGNFIHEGTLTFSPTETTPDVVFYQCQNHKAMGNRIFVVARDATVDLASLREKFGRLPAVPAAAALGGVADAEAKKKLSYAKMLAMTKQIRRIESSDSAAAKALLAEANLLLGEASAKLDGGDSAAAMPLVDEALRKFTAASQAVPSESVQAEQRQRYEELKKAVAERRANHKESFDRMVGGKGVAAGVTYDVPKVESLVAEGEKAAGEQRFGDAVKSYTEAERLVTAALNQMLQGQTVVYELKLDTPEGEYKYEMDRYRGYTELLPMAIEENQPNEGQRKLLDRYVAKAEQMREKAIELAGQGNHPGAIRLLLDATNEVRRALRLLGVQQ